MSILAPYTQPYTNALFPKISADMVALDAAITAVSGSGITIAGTSVLLGGSISRDTILGVSSNGLLKRTAANTLALAVAGTDYLTPTGNGSGLTGITASQVSGLSVFGTQYQFVENTGTITTTSTTFVVALTLTTPSLPAGNYLLQWSASASQSSAAFDMLVRVVHGANIYTDNSIHANDTANDYPIAGYKNLVGISGVNTFTFQIAVEITGTTSLKQPSLTIYCVS